MEIEINFSKIKLMDIDGKLMPDSKLHKTIANILYMFAKTVDLADVALDMNRGNSVTLSKKEFGEIRDLVQDPQYGIFTYARKAVLDYMEEVEEKADREVEKSEKPKRENAVK